jgi:hypothetical protein
MSALEPPVCGCGHYRYIHKPTGCPGWRHSDHYPWWANALMRVRINVMLRCKCRRSFVLYQSRTAAHTEGQG